MDSADLNATVVYRQDVTDGLAVVRVRPDGGAVPEFEPGQFATLGLPPDPVPESEPGPEAAGRRRPKMVRRAYSIASPPQVRDYLEFLVILVEGGRLTPKLWTLHEGGRLWMDNKIKGRFTLNGAPADKDLVMVSTGTGLGPFMSMLRAHRGGTRWRRLVMINGVRRVADLGYREELEETARSEDSFFYIPLVSREPPDSLWPGLRGRVQQVLEDGTYGRLVGTRLDPDQCHVFLCGNPDMIRSVQASLESRGFRPHTNNSPGNIHFERYW